jgi:hypothetical protein
MAGFYFSTLSLFLAAAVVCLYYPLNSPPHTLNKLYSILLKKKKKGFTSVEGVIVTASQAGKPTTGTFLGFSS